MSDDTIEEILKHEVTNCEVFNKLMGDIKELETYLVYTLGESEEYVEELEYSYIDKCLIEKTHLGYGNTNREFMTYRHDYMQHLMDIVEMKYPKEYPIMVGLYGEFK